jgi:hypothetical protein
MPQSSGMSPVYITDAHSKTDCAKYIFRSQIIFRVAAVRGNVQRLSVRETT